VSYASIPCPSCGKHRVVEWDEYQLIMKCQQFMCWGSCGMDIFAPAIWVFMNKVILNGVFQDE
jgi:hypothetical protein